MTYHWCWFCSVSKRDPLNANRLLHRLQDKKSASCRWHSSMSFLPLGLWSGGGIVVACVRPSVRPYTLPCPHDNTSQIWAGITKFGPCMNPGILHDDVINWKHFPRCWPFVLRIHRSPVNSPHKGQWRGALIFSFNKRLSKQSWDWGFEMPSRPLWRHSNTQLELKMEVINLNLLGHLGHFDSEF